MYIHIHMSFALMHVAKADPDLAERLAVPLAQCNGIELNSSCETKADELRGSIKRWVMSGSIGSTRRPCIVIDEGAQYPRLRSLKCGDSNKVSLRIPFRQNGFYTLMFHVLCVSHSRHGQDRPGL